MVRKLKYTREEIIKKFIEIHGDEFIYDKFLYEGYDVKGIIICKIHGEFLQSAHEHLKGCRCKKCYIDNMKMGINRFVELSNIKFNFKYIYKKFIYVNNKTKGIVICPIHGEFEIYPHHHLKGIGCRECYIESLKLSYDEFVKNAIKTHGDFYSYEFFIYIDTMTKGDIVCPKHGIFRQSPHDHCSGRAGCPKCSHSISKDEIKFINFLKEKTLDKLISQIDNDYNVWLDKFKERVNRKFKPDLFVLRDNEILLIIEFDGDFWHGNCGKILHPIAKKSDVIFAKKTEEKANIIKQKGFDIINIKSSEWKNYIKRNLISESIKSLFNKLDINVGNNNNK